MNPVTLTPDDLTWLGIIEANLSRQEPVINRREPPLHLQRLREIIDQLRVQDGQPLEFLVGQTKQPEPGTLAHELRVTLWEVETVTDPDHPGRGTGYRTQAEADRRNPSLDDLLQLQQDMR